MAMEIEVVTKTRRGGKKNNNLLTLVQCTDTCMLCCEQSTVASVPSAREIDVKVASRRGHCSTQICSRNVSLLLGKQVVTSVQLSGKQPADLKKS